MFNRGKAPQTIQPGRLLPVAQESISLTPQPLTSRLSLPQVAYKILITIRAFVDRGET